VCFVSSDSWACCASGLKGWAGTPWLGQEHGLRRRAPWYHGATAGILGPATVGRSFLLVSVPVRVWVLLVLIPTSGRHWGRRNGGAAVAERLQPRAAVFCADGLLREGEKEGRELHCAARKAVGQGWELGDLTAGEASGAAAHVPRP
jgi:hypothetical protein